MAASLEELLAQYQAQQKQASTMAEAASGAGQAALSAMGGGAGLIGAIAAPIAARYLGDAFGLNKRSAAEEAALGRIRNVAEGGQTAAQAALEYQRGRTARMATQAAAMGPARERAARQLVGQEQNIAAQQEATAQAAQVKMQEQARAQQAVADIETRAGEAERQRQRQMVAGAVTGGLGALAQSYGGYLAGQQRAKDLQAQAAGSQAAIDTIRQAQQRQTPAYFDERKIDSMTPEEAFAAASNQDPNMPMGDGITGGGLAPQSGTFEYDPLNERRLDGRPIGSAYRKTRGPNVTRFERGSY